MKFLRLDQWRIDIFFWRNLSFQTKVYQDNDNRILSYIQIVEEKVRRHWLDRQQQLKIYDYCKRWATLCKSESECKLKYLWIFLLSCQEWVQRMSHAHGLWLCHRVFMEKIDDDTVWIYGVHSYVFCQLDRDWQQVVKPLQFQDLDG